MALVAGIDSSTQSCKVVIRDADTGSLIRAGRAAHPNGTEVAPEHWWSALQQAIADAGGIADVAAVSVGAQQHGMVCLDDAGAVVRPALLWNDTRSAAAATDLISELGGPGAWADAVGLVPVASFTVTKLRWLAQHEPANAARTAAVCLPHDWLTWHLGGSNDLAALSTDRGDASGTGYWSPITGTYRRDLLSRALGHDAVLPVVRGPNGSVGTTKSGALLGPGTGDNMAAALGLGAPPGAVIVSVGTSGVASAVSDVPTADPEGVVAGFADATGRFLPLVATLNAARVLDATAALLGVDLATLSDLALSAPPGCDGLVLVPYLEGERTPNRPTANGTLHGIRLHNLTSANLARAAFEGVLSGLRAGLDALERNGVAPAEAYLVGGAARLPALRAIAPMILGRPVVVPAPGEYVADGAARQAAWALVGTAEAPQWQLAPAERYEADPVPWLLERYAAAAQLVLDRSDDDRPGPA